MLSQLFERLIMKRHSIGYCEASVRDVSSILLFNSLEKDNL